MDIQQTKASKFLALVLRHKPDTIGLELDVNGWASIDELIAKAGAYGKKSLDRALIEKVLRDCDKQRYKISEDGLMIRANQGHSISVQMNFKPVEPPEYLYHGTATRFIDSIRVEGLKPMSRQYVHLSADIETATKVGSRHGKPHILRINAKQMHEAGQEFYLAENGVWLSHAIAQADIEFDY